MRGNLILVEGLDRSGKSTQAEILAKNLNAVSFKFPDRLTPIGKVIHEYLTNHDFKLSDEAAHLLFSANRWELAGQIKETLLRGKHVVLDRYVFSGIAYSLAKENLKGVEWLFSPDRGLPKPDLTIFLTISLEELALRKGWGDERYEKSAFQSQVKHCFMQLLSPETDPSIVVKDVGGLSIEQVSSILWDIVTERTLDKANERQLQFF